MADTASVEFELQKVESIRRGPILAIADAVIVLDGVELLVCGSRCAATEPVASNFWRQSTATRRRVSGARPSPFPLSFWKRSVGLWSQKPYA